MIGAFVAWIVAHRRGTLVATGVALLAAGLVARKLTFDALPDLTNNQVLVLTAAPGFTPEEVERLVTRPVETALGGAPGLIEQRSLSRYGISSVTAVFDDGVQPLVARQLVQERLNGVSLPSGVEPPQLGPLTGGLGEVFHFTLSSASRTPAELYEQATLQVTPRLRSAPGVVEVNTWGGERRALEVRADAVKLAQRGLSLQDLRAGLEAAIGVAPGASVAAGPNQALLRAIAWPREPADLAAAVVRPPMDGKPAVRVGDVAEVAVGALPRIGAATADGRGETVYLMAQMLRGANALEVMDGLDVRMAELRKVLPPDVRIEVVYDRSVLVQATLRTVFHSLLEGGALVIAVLLLMLGSLRAGLLVALTIPLSMVGAAAGMVLFDVPGNLMSLGAIDFGMVVDGAVVLVEGLFHELAHDRDKVGDDREHFAARVAQLARGLAGPVFFSVLVILLVYVPVLSLTGADGKLFRPMAITVVLALLTALVLALTFVPAAAATFLRVRDVPRRAPLLVRLIDRFYAPQLKWAVDHPAQIAIGAVVLLGAGLFLFFRTGTEFVPQLDEGDLVIQTTRGADVSLDSAVREAGRLERAARSVPEVRQVVSRIGSPAVATDIMGLEQADVFVTLKPRAEWRPGLTREALIAELDKALQRGAPGGEPAFTQPIQMRFNELLGGAVSDVAVSVYGEDLKQLRETADKAAALIAAQPGAVDVRVLAPPEVALAEVTPRPLDAAQAGLSARAVLDAVRAVRTGIEVGATYDGPVRVPVLLKLAAETTAFNLAELAVPAATGLVPLGRVAQVELASTPSLINRHQAERRLVVGFNVRGGDLGSVAAGARQRLESALTLPPGFRLQWGGQVETLEQASARLRTVIPVVLVLILVVLAVAFRRALPAAVIFTNVPFACVGGIAALAARGLPVSLSAAVGFIALSGVAVLNGVVLMSKVQALEGDGLTPAMAAADAARSRARPVVTTALVAALGFIPMMLASGPGSEVQRPLATVVVGGLVTSTLLTLVILPSLYPGLARLLRKRSDEGAHRRGRGAAGEDAPARA